MKRVVVVSTLLLVACNPNKTYLDSNFHPVDRDWGSPNPLWSDEFDGPGLDPTKWVIASFCGGANGETQCYTNRPANVRVSGGHLIISARDERALKCDGADFAAVDNSTANEVGTVTCPASSSSTDYDYSSARIHTRVNPNGPVLSGWLYGRIEIRARLPYGAGTWPAFWMLPTTQTYGSWPRSGEIDIAEAINLDYANQVHDNADFVQSNIHLCANHNNNSYYHYDANVPMIIQTTCAAMNNGTGDFRKASQPLPIYFMQNPPGWQPDLVSNFHTYAMEWSAYEMRFYLDNRLIGQVLHGDDGFNRAPFRHGFNLILNLAIGGSWPGPAMPETTAAGSGGAWAQDTQGRHADLIVDWVRIYACMPRHIVENCMYQGTGLGELP